MHGAWVVIGSHCPGQSCIVQCPGFTCSFSWILVGGMTVDLVVVASHNTACMQCGATISALLYSEEL